MIERIRTTRSDSWVTHAVLGLVAFVPALLTAPGRVAADTRQALYLDPQGFLGEALRLWDSGAHLGSPTHSTIGNAFPMGTFFALTDLVGIEVWVAQRLWIGALLFAAGAGVLFLARSIRWRGPGIAVAALLYMLSPYALQYAPRTSVLLLPYVVLPWILGLTHRALHTGGWRHPAIIAILAGIGAGSNPSALLMVGIAPILWIGFAVWSRRTDARRAWRVIWTTSLLSILVCWVFITALVIESRYGLPVLSYTETLEQVSTTSHALEVLRGLGYWLFYGTEARLPNISGAARYLESTPILVASYAVPALALVAAFVTRWKYRALAIAMVVTGVVFAVAPFPYDDPSILGRAFTSFADRSSIALALRSSTRVAPVVVLGCAMLVGAGLNALWDRRRTLAVVAAPLAIGLVVVNSASFLVGDYVDGTFSRPASIPRYWHDAASMLDRDATNTRVLQIPGSSFAAYRWGSTYETPILGPLLDRPVAQREQIPFGTAASADLLAALDRRVQEGVLDPATLASIGRFLSAGHLLVQSDLEFERYDTVRPRDLWRSIGQGTTGLEAVAELGAVRENRPDPRLPLIDPVTLRLPADAADPPPIAIFRIEDAPPILRAVGARGPTVLDGDGEGLVDAASVGLVDARNIVLYAASLENRPRQRADILDAGADIVITDTNRRRERRWRSVRDNTGLTDRAGHDQPSTGQGEATLEVFPDTSDATRTVARPTGATIEASRYGSPLTFDTHLRAAMAVDGDPATAWELGTITDPIGERITIRSHSPITTDHIVVLQAQGGLRTRVLSEVALQLDGAKATRVRLDDTSLSPPGQRIEFAERTFTRLDLVLTGTKETPDIAARGGSPTGIAEITIPGLEFDDLVRLPTDLTDLLGPDSAPHRLVYLLTRLRSDPARRGDEEPSLRRVFQVPSSRWFSLSGTAGFADSAPDEVLDAVLGLGSAANGDVTATSSSHLEGAPRQRARSAFDGDLETHWSGTAVDQVGSWVQVDRAAPITLDRLDLEVIADGRHSVPTQLRIDSAGASALVDLPEIQDTPMPDHRVSVPITFPAMTGSSVRVTITRTRAVTSADAFSGRQLPLPIAIAEVGIPGVTIAAPPEPRPTPCRSDLITIDDHPVPVQILGSTSAAIEQPVLTVQTCGPPLQLGAGEHVLRTAPGRQTGIDVNRLVIGSDRGGGPLGLTDAGAPVTSPASTHVPRLRTLAAGSLSATVRVPPSDTPFWLVLGESHSKGWAATINDGERLPEPTLVNGYANGWLIEPSDHVREIQLEWAPQRLATIALIVSVLASLACLVLAWRGRRWSSADADADPDADGPRIEIPGTGDTAAPRRGRDQVLITLAAALAATIVVGPISGITVAAVVGLAMAWSRGRALLALASLALISTAMLGIVATQHSENRALGYEWISGRETEHRRALTGLLLLAADPLVARRWRQASRPSVEAGTVASPDPR